MAQHTGFHRYAAQAASAALPQEAEIVAFTRVNAELSGAADRIAELKALHRNHQLWSLLVRDVAMDGNRLPPALKDQLATLGLWSMQYSLAAMSRELPVSALTTVNANMIEALRAQLDVARGSVVASAGAANAPAANGGMIGHSGLAARA